ncbi:uncharacterized protein [Triticum aestivum]|uniref:uncharacterized protein n=1 Tax=Triticum aestivum TaxID=4565 RepID=UPI0008440A8F|nr:uncharacterized protein LOC123042982 [Triticum aestivum]
MMFGIDLNMSPQQDDASEPADQQEEHNSQQRYNNEEPVNNEATGEEASGVEEPIHEEASGVEETIHEEASAVQKPIHGEGRELTNEERYGIYFGLTVIKTQNGQVLKKYKEVIASLLDTTVRTVERIWERALKRIEQGEKVDVSNQKPGRVGRKRKDLDLSRVVTIPLNRRRTLRGLLKALGVSCTTLHSRFEWGHLRHHSNKVRPHLNISNIVKRLKWCLAMCEDYWSATRELDNIAYMDEKWFNMIGEVNNYYLFPEEPDPLRTLHHKDSIAKVMFLAAVAKPRYGEGGKVTFDGKLGIWAFVTESPAQRTSENRDKGTLELKSLKFTPDVMRYYMCEKLIPAIQERWLDEDEGRTIYIQQDNATPYILPDDPVFRQVVEQTDLDIKLLQQPPNSPDMNILDQCIFRSLQTHTDSRAPQSIRELIEGVEEEYRNCLVDKLARSFVTLQSCIREVMRNKGAINYSIPHMRKERRQAEGWLPITLSIDRELVEQTIAFIEEAKAILAAEKEQKQQEKSRSSLQEAETPFEYQQPPSSRKKESRAFKQQEKSTNSLQEAGKEQQQPSSNRKRARAASE